MFPWIVWTVEPHRVKIQHSFVLGDLRFGSLRDEPLDDRLAGDALGLRLDVGCDVVA